MVCTITLILVEHDLTFINRARCEQQKLMKKGQGQIIYVSDFVKEENGHLIICNQDGIVVKNA